MIGFSDLKSEMLVNLEDIINDLEISRNSSTRLLDLNYLTKVHSLKHQLLFHHLNNIASVIFELEKVAIRLVRDKIQVSSSLINMQHGIFTRIYDSIMSNSCELDEDISFYQSVLSKLTSINNLNKSAFDDEEDMNLAIECDFKKNCTMTKSNPIISFVDNMKKYQDVINNGIYDQDYLISIQDDFGEQFDLIRSDNVSYIANKLNYITKSVAADCGKTVKVHLNSKDFRVNKIVMNLLLDPLTQIIKNNIHHGFETVQERKELGKTSYGNLYINIYDYDTRLNIEIINDGRPIDINKIIKNIEKNKIKVENHELNSVLFTPFATSNDCPDINSGSGLGLSGVKRSVQSLGGTISVESNENLTMFMISVPCNYIYTYYSLIKCENVYFAIASKEVQRMNVNDIMNLDVVDLRTHRNDTYIPSNRLIKIKGKTVISEIVIRYYMVPNKQITSHKRMISGITYYKNKVVIIINSEYLDDIINIYESKNPLGIVFKNNKNEYVKIRLRDIVDLTFVDEKDYSKGYLVKHFCGKHLIYNVFNEICNLILINLESK